MASPSCFFATASIAPLLPFSRASRCLSSFPFSALPSRCVFISSIVWVSRLGVMETAVRKSVSYFKYAGAFSAGFFAGLGITVPSSCRKLCHISY